MANREHESKLELFGSSVRLLIGTPSSPGLPSPQIKALEIEALLRNLHRIWTRFDPSSELSRLNSNPQLQCQVSPTLAAVVKAGLTAAEFTSGLVDPTLLPELERAGYARSRVGAIPASLADALKAAPPRQAARPSPAARWRDFDVSVATGIVRRPPGVAFDSGGCGKGLAADLVSERLAGYETYAMDAGGDVRIGGSRPVPREVEVEHPLSDKPAALLSIAEGAVATSGLATRVWLGDDGYAHHLIDPSTGEPAWTGVIQATALAPTALEAETLAKQALLRGPDAGRRVLSEYGGLLILDRGDVDEIEGASELGTGEQPTEQLAVAS